ncbi:MAG: tyrosine-protein phosphatase [Novosphingobium sp.]
MRRLTGISLAILALTCPVSILAEDVAATPAVAESQRESRFIIVDGGRNLRDVGGYKTENGRHVRWQRLFRSGSPGNLTDAGRQVFAQLGAEAIIDLRSTAERKTDRGDWLKSQPGYWTRDYDLGFGNLSSVFADPSKVTGETVRRFMADGYRKTIDEQAPAYRRLFLQLGKAKRPVVVNCTAGKDRTGVATALVLRSLGVPYDTVRQDFLLSNNAPGMDGLRRSMGAQAAGKGSTMPPEVMTLLSGVDGSYLDAAFDEIDRKYGSLDQYLAKGLGLSRADIKAVRRNMVK